ncbi:hypothetical protein Tco_0888243 [Tanacetum coccineum]
MSMQRVESIEDALISIIKSIKKEMKDDIMKKQFEASITSISNETSSIASNEVDKDDNNTSITASYDYSLYAITTLEAKDNVMLLDVYKYLDLDKLRDAGTVEDTTGTNEPLGTIDILVKLGTLEFLCNFVIKMVDDVIILGTPFLESTQVRYGQQNIDDTTRERRYYEWVAQNYEFSKHQTLTSINLNDPMPTPQVHQESGNNEPRLYDVEEEYAREIGDLYSRRFDEYNRVFNNEIEHLSNEYILRIGKKGYYLDDVWEKCQQNYKKTNEAWHDEAYEVDKMW